MAQGQGPTKSGGEIRICGCGANKAGATNGAQYQDETYGRGARVHAKCDKGYRCTVCGREAA